MLIKCPSFISPCSPVLIKLHQGFPDSILFLPLCLCPYSLFPSALPSTSSWTTERYTPRFQDDSRPLFSITLPLPPCWQSETHTFSHHISKHLLCLFISVLASHPKLLLKKRTVFCLLVSSAHYSVWCKADINECFGMTACKADADMSSSDSFTSSCLLGA